MMLCWIEISFGWQVSAFASILCSHHSSSEGKSFKKVWSVKDRSGRRFVWEKKKSFKNVSEGAKASLRTYERRRNIQGDLWFVICDFWFLIGDWLVMIGDFGDWWLMIGLVGIECGSGDWLGSRVWPEPTAHYDSVIKKIIEHACLLFLKGIQECMARWSSELNHLIRRATVGSFGCQIRRSLWTPNAKPSKDFFESWSPRHCIMYSLWFSELWWWK